MWTISINSAINDGQNAHYDESCSSTLASTFSNGAKDPNTGVVSRYTREQKEDYPKHLSFRRFYSKRRLHKKYFIYHTGDKNVFSGRKFAAIPLLLYKIISKKTKIFFPMDIHFFTGHYGFVWKMHDNSQRDVRCGTGSRRSVRACSRSQVSVFYFFLLPYFHLSMLQYNIQFKV